MKHDLISYKPGAFYWRKAWRNAKTLAEQNEIFHALLRDHEALREWCRTTGYVPPKFEVADVEVQAKPWLLNPPGSQMNLALPEPVQPPGAEVFLFSPPE